ncbi:MAG TPA: division/cell wall cluster transcriptional repressor MraZ [Bacillota bacterium]
MLIGEYQHAVDAKGRLIMPARFREELGETFIVTRGLDQCLFVYPMDEWRTLENKLKALPMTQAHARAFVRFLFSGATECTLDRQGRILLPAQLREHAAITKDVMIIGVSTRAEIWAREQWQAYVEQAELSYNEIAEKLVDLGI